MNRDWDWPKHPDDKYDYYQEQKHGIVEIFVTLRLPVVAYETAAGYGGFIKRMKERDKIERKINKIKKREELGI